MALDLSKFKAKDCITLEIQHPDVEGVVFTLAGPHHPNTLRNRRERESKLIRTRKALTPAEREDIANDTLVARILGWKGIDWEGKELSYSEEAARTLITCPDLSFIRDQIALALADDESFFTISNQG